jgi:hypothetical protein
MWVCATPAAVFGVAVFRPGERTALSGGHISSIDSFYRIVSTLLASSQEARVTERHRVVCQACPDVHHRVTAGSFFGESALSAP